MAKFYVYALIDPRTALPFYIGKGKGARMDAHEKEARKGKYSRKCDAIRSIWAAGLQVVKLRLAEFSDEEEAYAFEEQEIERIGLENLTNVLPGGGSAYPQSQKKRGAFTEAHLIASAPRLARFFRHTSGGSQLIIHGVNVTDAVMAFARDLASGVGFDRFREEMLRHNIKVS